MDYGKGLTRQEATGLLKDLVMTRSVTGDEGRISAFIRDYLAGLGFLPIVLGPEGGAQPFYIRIQGRKPGSIAFVGHMDTVDVKGQEWIHEPFGAQVEGGFMYGRGSSDMKGGLVSMIAAAAWVLRNGIIPDRSLVFAFTVEEEKGYKGARMLTEAGAFKDAELVIIPEPTEGRVCIGQKGQLWVDAEFVGKAAHAAHPETGIYAALAAADFVMRIAEACEGFGYKKGLGRSTGSVDELHSGWQINVVPNAAKVGVDFRVVDPADHDKALAMASDEAHSVRDRWGVRSSVTVRQYVAPVVSDCGNELVRRFLDVKGAVRVDPSDLGVVAYSTDGSVIVPVCGAPLIIFGPGSILKAHQQEEFLVIEQIFDALDRLVGFLAG